MLEMTDLTSKIRAAFWKSPLLVCLMNAKAVRKSLFI